MTKRMVILWGLVAFISVGLFATFAGVVAPAFAAKRKLPIYSVETTQKVVALTFDCAWENSDTQRILDILKNYGVKATFFVTGDFCNRYNEDVRQFFAEGHDVQNHSYAHPHVENIDPQRLIADTKSCDDIIEGLTGKRPTLYRAPYGEYSESMLSVFEQTLGHKVIQWNIDSRDWQGREADAMAQTVMKKADNGAIILFHNDTKNTPEALEILIPDLVAKGFSFALVKDMIAYENYTIDHTGRQHLAAKTLPN